MDIKIGERIALLAACANEQYFSSEDEDGKPFHNTLELTPNLVLQLLSTPDSDEFFREYLRFKFDALLAMENGRTAADVISQKLGITLPLEGEASTLEELLIKFLPTERNAYLARLSQLAKEAVIEQYYFIDDSFTQWANFVENKYLWYLGAFSKDSDTRNQTEHRLDEFYEKDGISFIDEINLEYFEGKQISNIAKRQRTIFGHLRDRRGLVGITGDASASVEVPTHERHILHLDRESQAAVRSIISEISDNIVSREGLLTIYDVMQVVVDCIVARYHCSFADYLIFDSARETLWFSVSSLRPTTEAIANAGPHLHYGVGQGISGSVCYLEASADARWVGTNDLANDPRASLYHLRNPAAHEHHLYGKVSDYWLFPLFASQPARLLGALRVINRVRKSDHRGPAWSLLDKLEIAEFTRALELFLPLFHHDDIEQSSRDEGLTPKSATIVIQREWEADWIDPVFCRRLISHLMQVALQKVEDYSLGCNICVVRSEYVNQVIGKLPPYPPAAGLVRGHQDFHTDFYSFVHPRAATFVFTERGEFIGCRELISRQTDDSLQLMNGLIRDLPSSSIAFFVLDRGTKLIRIYGENEGDIYLREDTGCWVQRSYLDLLTQAQSIVDASDLADSGKKAKQYTIERVFKRVWDLALERTSAILVIANGYPERIEEQTLLAAAIELDDCPPVTFSDLARKDGAVWINWSQVIEKAGVMVGTVTGGRRFEKHDKRGGARHGAARSVSQEVPDSLAFVVSQNGGISAFFNGQEVFYRA